MMARPRILHTYVQISIPGVSEHEVKAEVGYVVWEGFEPDLTDPGSPDEVQFEMLTLVPEKGPKVCANWLMPALLDGNDEIIAECHQDWREDMAEAAAYRAEARREAFLEDR